MTADSHSLATIGAAVFWVVTTLLAYQLSKYFHQRRRVWWLSPILVAPLLLSGLLLLLGADYRTYTLGGNWLMLMLGPATVAFAVPIHRERAMIRRHWKLLAIGVTTGSTVAVVSAWTLASILQLDETLRQSILPRSVTTPFAMEISTRIGGVAELTAVLVVITGLFGAVLGERILAWLPADARFARGAAYGMAAHGVGVARAYETGPQEGAIAGLTMVLAGVLNVLLLPVLVRIL